MRVKVCGIRTIEAAQACAAASINGATVDFAGLNFVPGRNRTISAAFAAQLVPALGATEAVGVFSDQGLTEVRAVADEAGIGIVQLHGAEPPQTCAELAADFRVFKALDLRTSRDSELIAAYARCVDVFVIDGREPGSGHTWAFAQLALQSGCLAGVPVLLAGGLNPENVAEGIAKAAPWGVDCASGIERVDPATGRRLVDPIRIAAFTTAARQAGATNNIPDAGQGWVRR